MKKILFALFVMAIISFASCNGNANNQEVTEENFETVIDSVCTDEPENDTLVSLDSIEGEQTEVATEVQE